MSKTFQKTNHKSMPVSIAIGAVMSVAITLLFMVIYTQLLNTSVISEGAMSVICPVIWFIASFAGCLIASMIYKKQFMLVSVITALTYFAVLFSVSALFLDGNYHAIGWGILSILLGSIPVILLNIKKSRASKSKFKYRKA